MPSISDQVKQNQQRLAAAQAQALSASTAGPGIITPVEKAQPTAPNLITPPAAPLPVTGLPVRGYYPQGVSLDQDFGGTAQVTRTGVGMRSPTFPKQQSSITTVVKAIVSAASAAVSTGFKYLVNNVLSPTQSVLNILQGTGMQIVMDGLGNVTFTSTNSGDGLTHGDAVWEYDSAYVEYRDDFSISPGQTVGGTSIPVLGIGELSWRIVGGTTSVGSSGGFLGGGPPNPGQFGWMNVNTLQVAGWMTLPTATLFGVGNSSATFTSLWALSDYPGWKAAFIFKWDGSFQNGDSAGFITTKKAMYVGMAGNSMAVQGVASSGGSSRPKVFMGVRYDTSAGLSFVLSSVAASSGGTAVYTGTITNGTTPAFIGAKFTIAGFSNSVNNGTFICTACSTTSLTLTNTAAVIESAGATAKTPALNDSFFTLEVVANKSYGTAYRDNTQGTTLVTNVTPVAGVWHRVEIICNTAGQVTITLDGSSTNTLTTSIPTYSFTGTMTGGVTKNVARLQWTTSEKTLFPASPFAADSMITISGFTSTRAALNGTQRTLATSTAASGTANQLMFDLTNSDVADATDSAVVVTGYPALFPLFMFGNDDTNSTPTGNQCMFVADFFAFIWNTNLGPNAPGSPVVTNPRYW